MKSLRVLNSMILAAVPLLIPGASAQEQLQSLTLSVADQQAAASESHLATHALGLKSVNRRTQWAAGRPAGATTRLSTLPTPPAGFNPGDLSNPWNGQTLQTATSHNLYVNGTPGVWGSPATFLNNLNQSTMMHITDEYVGTSIPNRYPVGSGGLLNGALPHSLDDSWIAAIAHLGAVNFGSGYNHIYHIYLPPGQDVCITGTPFCYSPDNLNTFYFCAYHGSADFSDVGHVLFTVEPYQNVYGCQVQAPSPNGLVVDSTASVLSHELFETITDPDGYSWWNKFDLDLFGAEIGDECQNWNFGYGFVNLNGTKYEIQPEYSTQMHACTYSPHGLVQ